MKFLYHFLLLLITLQGFVACKDDSNTPIIPPDTSISEFKVLFIGNSFTFYNNGVDYHLQKMLDADGTNDSVRYFIDKIAVSSYTLQAHYQDSLTQRKIRSNKWTHIVLQEQSTRPINNAGLFLEFATKLDTEIKNVKAQTTLFMTWAPKDSPNDITELAASYISIGSKLNAKVVPVGKVWNAFINANPLINLYFTDDKHPSLSGTYLVSCAFYYSLFNKNPMNNTYLPTGISIQNATSIRKGVYDYLK